MHILHMICHVNAFLAIMKLYKPNLICFCFDTPSLHQCIIDMICHVNVNVSFDYNGVVMMQITKCFIILIVYVFFQCP